MMKFVIALVVLPFLMGCGSRQYVNERENEKFNRDHPYADTRAAGGQGDTGGALASVVASAITLASNRDYYRNTAITGKCLCKKDGMVIPCGSIEVILTDGNHKQVGSTQTDVTGEFAFRVQKNTPYRIEIKSSKFRVGQSSPKSYYLGDDVILNLVRK